MLKSLQIELNEGQEIIAWSTFAISAIMCLSIFIRPLRRLLEKEKVKRVYLPIIFYISFVGYTISWTSALGGMSISDVPYAVYGGFIWLLTYGIIMVGSSGKKVGLFGASLFIIAGVYALFQGNIIRGIVVFVFGVILLVLGHFWRSTFAIYISL